MVVWFLYLHRAASRGRRREGVEEGFSFGVAICDISSGFPVFVCGDGMRSVFYQLVKLGWFPLPTSSGGLLPLWGVLLSGELGLSTAEASDIRFSGDVMAFGHLVRPARSASKVCWFCRCTALGAAQNLCFFVGRMVGFNETVPAVGDEDIREKLAGTWLYFLYLSRVLL